MVWAMPVRSSCADTLRMPFASIWNRTWMRGRPGGHRRDAAQLEAAERPVVGGHLALALQDVDVHRRLAVDERREHLAAARRDRRVAQDDLRHDPAHGLDAERERRDVEQQHLAAAAHEDVGLHGRADGHDLVGVEVRVGRCGRTAAPPRGGPSGCASTRRRAPPRRPATASSPASSRARRHGSSVRATMGAMSDSNSARVMWRRYGSARPGDAGDVDVRRLELREVPLRLDDGLAHGLHRVGLRRRVEAEVPRHHLHEQPVDVVAAEVRVAVGRRAPGTRPPATLRIEMSNVPPPRS